MHYAEFAEDEVGLDVSFVVVVVVAFDILSMLLAQKQ
jgi:hypothetical protein